MPWGALGLPRKVAHRRGHGRIAAVVAPTRRSRWSVCARLGPMGGERAAPDRRRCDTAYVTGSNIIATGSPTACARRSRPPRLDAEPIAFDRRHAGAGQVDRFPALVDGRRQSTEHGDDECARCRQSDRAGNRRRCRQRDRRERATLVATASAVAVNSRARSGTRALTVNVSASVADAIACRWGIGIATTAPPYPPDGLPASAARAGQRVTTERPVDIDE